MFTDLGSPKGSRGWSDTAAVGWRLLPRVTTLQFCGAQKESPTLTRPLFAFLQSHTEYWTLIYTLMLLAEAQDGSDRVILTLRGWSCFCDDRSYDSKCQALTVSSLDSPDKNHTVLGVVFLSRISHLLEGILPLWICSIIFLFLKQ